MNTASFDGTRSGQDDLELSRLMRGQIDYYGEIAATGQYDRAYARIGRYNRGVKSNTEWLQELEAVSMRLDEFAASGDVLELACGNGRWTGRLLRTARSVTAVDAAPQMLRLNQQRVADRRVSYVLADIFNWEPGRRFDSIVFCLWLSHVPTQLFEEFWRRVENWLVPGGCVFFMDALYEPERTAIDEVLPDKRNMISIRKLDEGRTYRIVKVFYESTELQERLTYMGWQVRVMPTGRFFYCGKACR